MSARVEHGRLIHANGTRVDCNGQIGSVWRARHTTAVHYRFGRYSPLIILNSRLVAKQAPSVPNIIGLVMRRAAFTAVLACGYFFAVHAHARTVPDALPVVSAGELPREAREVLVSIYAGGPFRFDRDGVQFGNRERLLPGKVRGHYREYTVPTPGVRHRGGRRIVCGGPVKSPDACYYTADHYRSFARIRE